MEIKPSSEVMRELLKLYRKSKHKEDWRVLTGRTPKGLYNTFISTDNKLWLLEAEPISSREFIAVGSEVANLDENIRKIMDRGAPVPFGVISPQNKYYSIILAGIQQYSSDSIYQLRKEYFSDKQADLEAKLKEELNRLITGNPWFAKKYREQKERESKSYI